MQTVVNMVEREETRAAVGVKKVVVKKVAVAGTEEEEEVVDNLDWVEVEKEVETGEKVVV